MPTKKTRVLSSDNVSGVRYSEQSLVTAFIYFNCERGDYEMFGVTHCPRNYQLLAKNIASCHIDDEEIDSRLKLGEALCVQIEVVNGKIGRTTVVIKPVSFDQIQKWQQEISQAILNDRLKTIQIEADTK